MDKVFELLKMEPVVIPRIFFQNYRKLNVTSDEFLLLIYFFDQKGTCQFNPVMISEVLGFKQANVLQLVNELNNKGLVDYKIQKNKLGVMEEHITLDPLYQKLSLLIMSETNKESEEKQLSLFETFEKEFGRPLSPMEFQIIDGWVKEKFSEELILEALKEAIYNGVSNLRYIDKILYEWSKKGYKSVSDVQRNQRKEKVVKEDITEIFDYNWLEDADE